jgi:hypothetical protein
MESPMPTPGRRRHFAFTVPLACACAFALACSDAPGVDPFADRSPPTVQLERGPVGPDTVLNVIANVQDNLGIKTVSVRVSGGITAARDTTFTSAVTSIELGYSFPVPRSVPPGTGVTVVALASDGAGNVSEPDTLLLATGNLAPAEARITSPASGTVAVVGKSLVLSISGKTGLKVRAIGFQTSGVLTTADSSVFSSPLSDSLAIRDTLTIPEGTSPGQLTITPFVRDSLGQRTLGPALVVTVQTAASTTSSPVVSFGITPRVEVTDTINVAASDQTGVTTMGYEIRRSPTGAVDVADSIISSGNITSLLHTFTLRLPYTSFPTQIFVKAFATNSNGVRAYARLATGLDRVDTVTVVAGMTRPLPQGGVVADALYHPARDRLYLTNIERNRLEVFELADTSFKAAISTGSRPWGVAPWPRDRNGTMADTLLVANSGGTSIGYIRLAGEPLFPTGRQFATYALPNIIVYSITSVESSTAPGVIIQQRTRYDFSDRPQYLAATCRGSGPSCGDVILIYSTTPTGGQTLPFENQGSIRWENLTQETSHFFFEQAIGQTAGRADTLIVERFAAGGRGTDAVLVPYRNEVNGGPDSISIVVDLPKLAFRDTTFARHSGNFRRAVLGEGGPVLGSRTLMYDAVPGLAPVARINEVQYTFTNPVIDAGVSRAADVSDFIGNAFARVGGAAINFDGELAAIRGDSTYLLDPTLRLQGLLPTSGGNPGFDFHPGNIGNPNVAMQACFSFAASTEPVIEVYENRHFQRVTTIPVRDPIIGPIKAAKRTASGDIVLVGATARGVVVVTLQDTFTGCPG